MFSFSGGVFSLSLLPKICWRPKKWPPYTRSSAAFWIMLTLRKILMVGVGRIFKSISHLPSENSNCGQHVLYRTWTAWKSKWCLFEKASVRPPQVIINPIKSGIQSTGPCSTVGSSSNHEQCPVHLWLLVCEELLFVSGQHLLYPVKVVCAKGQITSNNKSNCFSPAVPTILAQLGFHAFPFSAAALNFVCLKMGYHGYP